MTNEEFKNNLGIFYHAMVFPHYYETWETIHLEPIGTVGSVLMKHPFIKDVTGWLSEEDRLKVLDVNFIKESIETCLNGTIDND